MQPGLLDDLTEIEKGDLSPEYVRAVLDKAKEFLPDWLWKQLHKMAFPSSGGRARWRKSEEPTFLEKMALADMRPGKLADAPDSEVRQAWLRLNQWYGAKKKRGEAVEDVVNAAVWVAAEMRSRKFDVDQTLPLAVEAQKLTEVTKGSLLSGAFDQLPTDLLVVKDFVSVVGSTATDKAEPGDLDLLVRAHRADAGDVQNWVVQSENVWLPLRKILDPEKAGILHFISNPQGAHSDHVPLYDLVLRRRESLVKVVVKFDPDQPRDESGKWTEGGGGGGGEAEQLRGMFKVKGDDPAAYAMVDGLVKDVPELARAVIASGKPIALRVGDKMPKGVGGAGGVYQNATGLLQVRATQGVGYTDEPWAPEKLDAIADTGKTFADVQHITLSHELGHHIYATASGETREAIRGAWTSAFSAGKFVSKYASTHPQEHFAELVAAYSYHRDKLKSFDPVGYRTVELALGVRGA